MNITFACPIFFTIGPDSTKRGIPTTPPTVMVSPIKDLDAPKSSRSQNRKLSINPHAQPVNSHKKKFQKSVNIRNKKIVFVENSKRIQEILGKFKRMMKKGTSKA